MTDHTRRESAPVDYLVLFVVVWKILLDEATLVPMFLHACNGFPTTVADQT